MTTIILDNKMFDYSKIKEPLVAVPKSVWKNMQKNIKTPITWNKSSKKVVTKKTKSIWKLSEADILKSLALAKKEWAEGKTIKL
jgi:hypothetical protein